MAKQIKFNEEARSALKKGIDTLAEAVKMTLGPRGRAVVIDKGYGSPQVTFDGVTVAKEIELEGKYENLGAEFIKQAADKTNDNVGDGTTTSVVIAHSLIEEGEKAIKERGFNVINLAEELRKISEEIVDDLEKQKEEINDNKKTEEVATLSSKDAGIGRLIAEVMGKVGKEGVVTVEDSNTIGSSYEMVEGMQFDKGYVSQYMVTNQEKMEAELEEPYVLVTDRKISSISELLPLLEKIVQSGKKELFIVAEEIEGEALATLVVNKLRGIFNVLAVKAPGFGDRRKEMLQDIATVTGANFISEEVGRKLENVELNDLGQAHRIVANKDNTTIVGGKGDKAEIEKRLIQLRAQIEKTDSEFDREKLEERIGKLSGGVAVIKVGAATEVEQKEKQHRIEDAVSATKAAIEEGIVPGGGVALVRAAKKLHDHIENVISKSDLARMVGAKIVLEALYAPIKQIAENAGWDGAVVLDKVLSGSEDFGFNAATGKYENLTAAGIVDPTKVTRSALQNAVSVASMF